MDFLRPGLCEAKFLAKGEETANPDLATGNWVMRCEQRTLDDIRAFGGDDLEDDRRFATAARLSKANLELYRTLVQPWVRRLVYRFQRLNHIRRRFRVCRTKYAQRAVG